MTSQVARAFRRSEELMLSCWSYPLTHRDLSKLYTTERARCRAAMQRSGRNLGVDGEATYKAGVAATTLLVSPSSVLHDGLLPLLEPLRAEFPARCSLKRLKRIFSTDHDGCSLQTFYNRCHDPSPTILFVKTTRGDVFGASDPPPPSLIHVVFG